MGSFASMTMVKLAIWPTMVRLVQHSVAVGDGFSCHQTHFLECVCQHVVLWSFARIFVSMLCFGVLLEYLST